MSFLPSLGSCSEILPYPCSVSGHLSHGSLEEGSSAALLTRGSLSNQGGAALIHRGPSLEVIDVQSNERISSETFPSEITSLDSLGPDQVVVGLDSGIVSVLDIKISKRIKSISFPDRISSLAVIQDSAHRSLAEELMFFKGILAVGTQNGDLYLLDLALDKAHACRGEMGQGGPGGHHPLGPYFISPGVTTELADLRHSQPSHLCIHLNQDNTTKGGLVISSLAHIPQLGAVAVGYNSGSWKLVNLNRLHTEFTFSPPPLSSEPLLPCVGFAFQEPENDPRNHSYLWVMWSQNDIDTEEDKKALNTFASIELYALNYENKDEVDQYGVLYSGLTSCSKSFGFTLSGDPEDTRRAKSSMGLTTRTLGTLSSNRQSQLDISGTECDSIYAQGLCAFIWEVRSFEDPNSQYFLGVFDLNMWYQDQMPTEYIETDICPFLSYCSMEDVLATCPEGNILDVYVDLASISRCKSSIVSEKNSYPSSLSFDMIAILDKGFVQTSHLGLQKKVLLELQTDGQTSLVEPSNLYKLCCIAGFINESHTSGKTEQRSALLTVALEHNLVNLLTGCVTHWNDGKYNDEGCTMKALLDWAWQRIIFIKQMIDKVTAPLFDLSSLHFNENNQLTLIQNSQQLHHLCAVIQELIAQSVVASQLGYEELQIKMNVVRLVYLYVRVVLWFFSAGLLPELPEPESGSIPLLGRDSPYPYRELSATYKSKRSSISALHRDWGYSEVPLLLIDGLCSQFGSKLCSNFERDGGDGLYPPPTLFSLLSSYLIDDHRSAQINDVGKHRLIHYLFLDMADKRCSEEIWSELIDRLIQFPSAFSVPPSLIKLTQAFWLLDQGDFEEAMGMLLDPLILDKDIKAWEHRAIIVAFLVQDQPKAALKYSRIRKPPVRDAFDIKLHVSVLLSTGNVHEAFQFQRNRRNTCKDLLNYFFIQAEKLGKLNLLFELTLTTFEETEFVNFLQNSESSSEVLLMYYLQRYRFQEALAYHRLLKSKNLSTPTHQALMSRYSNLLPNLLTESKGFQGLKVTSGSLNKAPVPLSREIKMTNFNPLFHISTIEEKLEGNSSPNIINNNNIFTPFRPRGQRLNLVEKRRFVEVSKVKKDASEEDDLILQTPPSKRSRFIEPKTLMEESKASPPCKSLLASEFTQEVSSILCTPTIKRTDPETLRRRRTVGAMDSESPFPLNSSTSAKKLTPSILKTNVDFDTPPGQRGSLKGQEDSGSKYLRFHTPQKLPPPELKPVNPSDIGSEESEDAASSHMGSPSKDRSPSKTTTSFSSSTNRSASTSSRSLLLQKDVSSVNALSSSVSSRSFLHHQKDAPSVNISSSSISSFLSKDPSTSMGSRSSSLLSQKKTASPLARTPDTSRFATPRKPITDYLIGEEESNDEDEAFSFRGSVDTPKLSVSVSERIQSQLFEKSTLDAAAAKEEEEETSSSEEEDNDCLIISESESEQVDDEKDKVDISKKIEDKEESSDSEEEEVKNMIKDAAFVDVQKFMATRADAIKKPFKLSTPLKFQSKALQDSPLNFENVIKSRASIDFGKFQSTIRSSSSIIQSTSSTTSYTERKTLLFESSKTPDMSQVIKEQASMDFQFGRKPTEPIILIESAEKDDREEEVTPDKIKAKALKSAEEWVKNSPFIGPPPSRVLSRREPTHSSTATKNEEKVLEEEEEGDMDSMIKAAAQKDFDSHKSASEVRSDFSFNALSEDAAAPFKFSKQHQEDSEDSDILDDDEDAKEVSDSEEDAKEASGSEKDEEDMEVEEAPSSQRDPKFNFSHPISVEREEEDVLFSFSKGQSIESIKSDDEETNEFENVQFSFTGELSAVKEEDSKVEFAFSEPKGGLDKSSSSSVKETTTTLEMLTEEAPEVKLPEKRREQKSIIHHEDKKKAGPEATPRTIRRSKRISQLGGDRSITSDSISTKETSKSFSQVSTSRLEEEEEESTPLTNTSQSIKKKGISKQSVQLEQSSAQAATSEIEENETLISSTSQSIRKQRSPTKKSDKLDQSSVDHKSPGSKASKIEKEVNLPSSPSQPIKKKSPNKKSDQLDQSSHESPAKASTSRIEEEEEEATPLTNITQSIKKKRASKNLDKLDTGNQKSPVKVATSKIEEEQASLSNTLQLTKKESPSKNQTSTAKASTSQVGEDKSQEDLGIIHLTRSKGSASLKLDKSSTRTSNLEIDEFIKQTVGSPEKSDISHTKKSKKLTPLKRHLQKKFSLSQDSPVKSKKKSEELTKEEDSSNKSKKKPEESTKEEEDSPITSKKTPEESTKEEDSPIKSKKKPEEPTKEDSLIKPKKKSEEPTKYESSSKTSPRSTGRLRSAVSEERELSMQTSPSKGSGEALSKKSTHVSTPRRLRSTKSEEKEIPQPRRSKRLSHSSVLPVLSSLEESSRAEEKSRMDVEDERGASKSKLNVIQEEGQEEKEEEELLEAPTPKRSVRSKKPTLCQGTLPLLPEEHESSVEEAATPLRKSKRLSARSSAYDDAGETPTAAAATTISKAGSSKKLLSKEESSEDEESLLYSHEEPFDAGSSISKEDKKSPSKSERKTSSKRKKYVVKKKVVSQKIFF